MLLSLSWLREFVPYAGTGAELGDKLTMAGLELESLSRPREALRSIVVGYVAECGPHPEADKLSVCRVDVGDEALDIVCGAPNVAQGQKVAVVKVGVTLPNGLTVKKAKLRGKPSHGMICSEFELGLSDDHDGILVLDPSATVGASLLDVLPLDDELLDVSITPNRGDCLSVLGLAREVSAITGLPLTKPAIPQCETGEDASGMLSIEVLEAELCPLYIGRIIENAVTAKAPDWMRYRLNLVGVRCISNLVDVTNYILLELGQPLHAFDLDAIRGGRVLIRAADEGERLTTLDGVNRVLTASDITIRDAEGIMCLGGVMGGLDSEITSKSTRVFLESAIFNPTHIRKTSRRLGLSSEASYRFERGVDQTGARHALDRAANLMAQVSGGQVRPGLLKHEPLPWQPPRILLRKARAEALLGIPLDAGFCRDTLQRLGCGVQEVEKNQADVPTSDTARSPERWMVTPPGARRDITREADVIEEIVRMYGVDRIPAVIPTISHSLQRAGLPESMFSFISRVKHWGLGVGLHEAINYSFVSHRELDHLGVPAGEGSARISIMNPLSDELNVLRTHLIPGLLNTLRNNLSQGASSVRIFEVAGAFSASPESETTANEVPHLGIMFNGLRYDHGWPQPGGDFDYLDLKGIIEHLVNSFALPAAAFSRTDNALPWLAPCVSVTMNGRHLGTAGRVKPDVADPYHAKKPVWIAEIDLEVLRELNQTAIVGFRQLPMFPPIRRDITFIAESGLEAGTVVQAIKDLQSPLLNDVRLIDCFEPEGKDERNLTCRLTFRHASRTLKDAEVDKQRDQIVKALQEKLGVRV